jgi:hypothetical protein
MRLSALGAGRALPPGRFLVLVSVRGRVHPRAIVRLEWLGAASNNTVRNFVVIESDESILLISKRTQCWASSIHKICVCNINHNFVLPSHSRSSKWPRYKSFLLENQYVFIFSILTTCPAQYSLHNILNIPLTSSPVVGPNQIHSIDKRTNYCTEIHLKYLYNTVCAMVSRNNIRQVKSYSQHILKCCPCA